MANIGTFKKSGNDYQGDILTLSVQQKNVRIVAEDQGGNDNAPTHRVFVAAPRSAPPGPRHRARTANTLG